MSTVLLRSQADLIRGLLADRADKFEFEVWASVNVDSKSRLSRIRQRAADRLPEYERNLALASETLAAFNTMYPALPSAD
jgi:hypothetical protein